VRGLGLKPDFAVVRKEFFSSQKSWWKGLSSGKSPKGHYAHDKRPWLKRPITTVKRLVSIDDLFCLDFGERNFLWAPISAFQGIIPNKGN